jgi:hypothetical protein
MEVKQAIWKITAEYFFIDAARSKYRTHACVAYCAYVGILKKD